MSKRTPLTYTGTKRYKNQRKILRRRYSDCPTKVTVYKTKREAIAGEA